MTMTEKVIKKVKIGSIESTDGFRIRLILSDGEEIVFRINEVGLRNLAVEIAEVLFPEDAGKIDMIFACMFEYK